MTSFSVVNSCMRMLLIILSNIMSYIMQKDMRQIRWWLGKRFIQYARV